MKHKVRVIGIVRGKGGILLLKKSASEEPTFWEMPAGKIEFGEQPEEAMGRILFEQIGIRMEKIVLRDVVCFLGLYGESDVASLYIIYDIKFNDEKKIELSEGFSAYKFMHGADFQQYVVGDASKVALGLTEDRRKADSEEDEEQEEIRARRKRFAMSGATVYVDGASRGNPGPAGIGYYILSEEGEVLEKGGMFVGFASSRVAEYYALRKGVERAKELGLKRVRFVGDSLMMINQMNGVYKVKNQDILPLYKEIKEMAERDFEATAFLHVKRERNVEADREANLAVDRGIAEEKEM